MSLRGLTFDQELKCEEIVNIFRKLPRSLWKTSSISSDPIIIELTDCLIEWIDVVRETNKGSSGNYNENWFPSLADIIESSLFSRIRYGKKALPEPPPQRFSCPWYTVVEEPGPHLVDFTWTRNKKSDNHLDDYDLILWENCYKIVGHEKDFVFIIKSIPYQTSYRFYLWWDDDVSPKIEDDGTIYYSGQWLMQNVEFRKDQNFSPASKYVSACG